MLNSSKAKEIASIRAIEDMIRDAALKGNYRISVSGLSDDAKRILLDNGYDIIINIDGEKMEYVISWDK